jgi:hypothetical protein
VHKARKFSTVWPRTKGYPRNVGARKKDGTKKETKQNKTKQNKTKHNTPNKSAKKAATIS